MKKVLLFSLVIVMCGTVFAGSLEPSAGPGSTMKTLDEVEPRTAINAVNTPGDASYEYIISNSGSYYLTGEVNTAKGGISVNTNDVTIDLSGFSLIGPGSGTPYGIYMNGRENVEIRNGTVRDFYYGIYAGSTLSHGHRIIEVRVMSNLVNGIYLLGRNHIVRDCTVGNNCASASISNAYGIYVFNQGIVTGNSVYGNGTSATVSVNGIDSGSGSTISNNEVYDNGKSVINKTIIGIGTGYGSTISDNSVYNNGSAATGSDVRGINVNSGCTVKGNSVVYNGHSPSNATASDAAYGIRAFGSSTVLDNSVYNNGTNAGDVYGIFAGYGSMLSRNTVHENGESAGNIVYGIYTESGCTIIGNSSYSNGDNAATAAYGISPGTDSLVDQNTTTYNGTGAPVADNMNICATCTFGLNHAPL